MSVLPRDAAALVVLAQGDTELARWHLLVDVDTPLDLAVVDRLAGLQLVARRMGYSIELRDPCPTLVALLDLTGLTRIIPIRPSAGGHGWPQH